MNKVFLAVLVIFALSAVALAADTESTRTLLGGDKGRPPVKTANVTLKKENGLRKAELQRVAAKAKAAAPTQPGAGVTLDAKSEDVILKAMLSNDQSPMTIGLRDSVRSHLLNAAGAAAIAVAAQQSDLSGTHSKGLKDLELEHKKDSQLVLRLKSIYNAAKKDTKKSDDKAARAAKKAKEADEHASATATALKKASRSQYNAALLSHIQARSAANKAHREAQHLQDVAGEKNYKLSQTKTLFTQARTELLEKQKLLVKVEVDHAKAAAKAERTRVTPAPQQVVRSDVLALQAAAAARQRVEAQKKADEIKKLNAIKARDALAKKAAAEAKAKAASLAAAMKKAVEKATAQARNAAALKARADALALAALKDKVKVKAAAAAKVAADAAAAAAKAASQKVAQAKAAAAVKSQAAAKAVALAGALARERVAMALERARHAAREAAAQIVMKWAAAKAAEKAAKDKIVRLAAEEAKKKLSQRRAAAAAAAAKAASAKAAASAKKNEEKTDDKVEESEAAIKEKKAIVAAAKAAAAKAAAHLAQINSVLKKKIDNIGAKPAASAAAAAHASMMLQMKNAEKARKDAALAQTKANQAKGKQLDAATAKQAAKANLESARKLAAMAAAAHAAIQAQIASAKAKAAEAAKQAEKLRVKVAGLEIHYFNAKTAHDLDHTDAAAAKESAAAKLKYELAQAELARGQKLAKESKTMHSGLETRLSKAKAKIEETHNDKEDAKKAAAAAAATLKKAQAAAKAAAAAAAKKKTADLAAEKAAKAARVAAEQASREAAAKKAKAAAAELAAAGSKKAEAARIAAAKKAAADAAAAAKALTESKKRAEAAQVRREVDVANARARAAAAGKVAKAKAEADAKAKAAQAAAEKAAKAKAESEKRAAADAHAAIVKAAQLAAKAKAPIASTRFFHVASSSLQVQANLAAQKAYQEQLGNVRVVKYVSAPANNAHYVKFGKMVDAKDGFDMQFSAKGSNDVHIAFLTDRVARSNDAWEVVLGGWGNSRSVIRQGTQGIELTSIQSNQSVGPSDAWRYYWLSYDADTHILSVWDDTGNYGDAPLMTTTVPALSSTQLYPAFGAWDSPVKFKAPNYVNLLEYDAYIADRDADAQHVETTNATDLIELDAF